MIATLIIIGALLALLAIVWGIAEAQYALPHGELHVPVTTRTTLASGEIIRAPDGRAAYCGGLNSRAAGDGVTLVTSGVVKVKKSTSVCLLPGQEIWWDPTNNYATYKLAGETASGFFVGVCVDGALVSAATTQVTVDLNVKPTYDIELGRTPFTSAIVAAAGAPTANMEYPHHNVLELIIAANDEAEKADALSDDSFACDGEWIVEGIINVIAASNAALDINVGIANATHGSDMDSATESVLIHIDGNSVNILAESDDGTTEVAATDTTKDYALGTAFFFQMYGRDETDIQILINGALVLPASVFTLADATGPMKLLAHAEKSAGADADEVNIRDFRGLISKAA